MFYTSLKLQASQTLRGQKVCVEYISLVLDEHFRRVGIMYKYIYIEPQNYKLEVVSSTCLL